MPTLSFLFQCLISEHHDLIIASSVKLLGFETQTGVNQILSGYLSYDSSSFIFQTAAKLFYQLTHIILIVESFR